VKIGVFESEVVVVMLVGRWCCAAHPASAAWSKLHTWDQFEMLADKHCTPKMLGIDYPDSDEDDVVPATKPEVRLANVLEGLR
jgi:hypothetical protein